MFDHHVTPAPTQKSIVVEDDDFHHSGYPGGFCLHMKAVTSPSVSLISSSSSSPSPSSSIAVGALAYDEVVHMAGGCKAIGEVEGKQGGAIGEVDAAFECTGVPTCVHASIFVSASL